MEIADTKLTTHEDKLVGTTILDKYLVLSVLGEGGWGIVYKAKHQTLDRFVAIKTMHAHFARDPEKIKRFEQEARAASALRNENVAQVYDFGVLPNGQPYFVMDFVDGATLGSLIRNEKSLDEERALKLFRMICRGLEAAHGAGVIHRDIKPNNIFIVQDPAHGESVRLIDFGLAKLVTPDGSARDHLTLTGETIGTPPYMSPEQCMGRVIDARGDIYSLGCVMYEALTGQVAFAGQSPFECMSMHVSDPPKPFKSVCDKKINPAIEAIVMRCLEKKPEDRYQTVHALLHDLNVLPRPRVFRNMRWSRQKAAGVIVAAASLAGLAFAVPYMVPHTETAVTPPAVTPVVAPVPIEKKPPPEVSIQPTNVLEKHYAIDPKNIKVVPVKGSKFCWLNSKGKNFCCFPTLKAAMLARDVFKFYGATEFVTLGPPVGSPPEFEMTYFLTPIGIAQDPMPDEDTTGEYDPRQMKVQLVADEDDNGKPTHSWKVIYRKDEWMMDFGDDQAAASLAVQRIRQFDLRHMCYFDYGTAEQGRFMPYFRQ